MQDTIKDNCIVLTPRLYCHRGADWINPITIAGKETEAARGEENKFWLQNYLLNSFFDSCNFVFRGLRLGRLLLTGQSQQSRHPVKRRRLFTFTLQLGTAALFNFRLKNWRKWKKACSHHHLAPYQCIRIKSTKLYIVLGYAEDQLSKPQVLLFD